METERRKVLLNEDGELSQEGIQELINLSKADSHLSQSLEQTKKQTELELKKTRIKMHKNMDYLKKIDSILDNSIMHEFGAKKEALIINYPIIKTTDYGKNIRYIVATERGFGYIMLDEANGDSSSSGAEQWKLNEVMNLGKGWVQVVFAQNKDSFAYLTNFRSAYSYNIVYPPEGFNLSEDLQNVLEEIPVMRQKEVDDKQTKASALLEQARFQKGLTDVITSSLSIESQKPKKKRFFGGLARKNK